MTPPISAFDSRWKEWGAMRRQVVRPQRGHFVYVAWGLTRRPLYVGKSRGVLARIGAHLVTATWARKVVKFEIYSFETEDAALDAEALAIVALDPIHNVAGIGAERAAITRNTPKRSRVPRLKRTPPPAPDGYPDYFTEEQWEIVHRTQKAGRP